MWRTSHLTLFTLNNMQYKSLSINHDWLIDWFIFYTHYSTDCYYDCLQRTTSNLFNKRYFFDTLFLWNVYDTVCYLALYWDPTEEIIIFRIFAWKNLLSTLSLWCIQDNIFRIYTLLYMYCICFTQNEDNGGHKICRGPDDSVLKQFIIYRRRGGNEGKIY